MSQYEALFRLSKLTATALPSLKALRTQLLISPALLNIGNVKLCKLPPPGLLLKTSHAEAFQI